MVRPPLRSTHRVCSSKRTAFGEVVIPSSQEGITVLRYDAENMAKLSSIEAVAGERPTESGLSVSTGGESDRTIGRADRDRGRRSAGRRRHGRRRTALILGWRPCAPRRIWRG